MTKYLSFTTNYQEGLNKSVVGAFLHEGLRKSIRSGDFHEISFITLLAMSAVIAPIMVNPIA